MKETGGQPPQDERRAGKLYETLGHEPLAHEEVWDPVRRRKVVSKVFSFFSKEKEKRNKKSHQESDQFRFLREACFNHLKGTVGLKKKLSWLLGILPSGRLLDASAGKEG